MGTDNSIKLLFLGDIIGKPGRRVAKEYLSQYGEKFDLVIANVENAAHGFGVAESNLQELADVGVKIFTGGNHTFDRKEIFTFIDKTDTLLRPANYPDETPGRGYCVYKLSNSVEIAVLNIMGQVFMQPLASPFAVAEKIITFLKDRTKIILVDFHAEATAEKVAMGWFLDGKVSAVVGTHTHIQTADERILPNGTAYLTDAGCCGPTEGIIGMDKKSVFRRMIQQLPARFEVAEGPAQLCGAVFTIDVQTGRAIDIERIRYSEQSSNPKAEEQAESSSISA